MAGRSLLQKLTSKREKAGNQASGGNTRDSSSRDPFPSPRHPALGFLDEMDEVLDVGVGGGGGGFQGADAVGEADVLFQEQALVGGLEVADVGFGKAAALEAD